MNFFGHWIHRWERILTLRDRNRRIFPFQWGLDCIDDNGRPARAEDPLACLKEYVSRALEDSSDFFRPPPLKSWDLQGDLLRFPAPVLSAAPENNTVYCRLFPNPRSRTAVIVLPQWNAAPESHVTLCRILQRFGITAARLTMPYHEQRRPSGMQRADHMVSPNIGRTLQATRAAVLEVRMLTDWLQRQGYRRIGVMGTSIGSCVTYLAFTHEPALCSGVFNHVSSFFADVVWTGLSTRYVRWGLEGHIGLEDLRDCWSPISPWHFIGRLKTDYRPHLLITARYDLTFRPELAQRVFDEYQRLRIPCRRVVLPCGHYTTAAFPFKYLVGWHICRYLIGQLSQSSSAHVKEHFAHRAPRRG